MDVKDFRSSPKNWSMIRGFKVSMIRVKCLRITKEVEVWPKSCQLCLRISSNRSCLLSKAHIFELIDPSRALSFLILNFKSGIFNHFSPFSVSQDFCLLRLGPNLVLTWSHPEPYISKMALSKSEAMSTSLFSSK